jgi:hypothetical protein
LLRHVTGKWLLKNRKLTTRLKNKTQAKPQTKNHKNSHELRLIRRQTRHRNPEQMHLNSLTPLILSTAKIVNLHRLKEVFKPRHINVVFSQCGSLGHGSASYQT